MSEDEILEPSSCESCGQEIPAPPDGKWRFARGAKVYDSLAIAEVRAGDLTRRRESKFDFRAVTDRSGRVRIASRRRV
jgi:hypothetical protein